MPGFCLSCQCRGASPAASASSGAGAGLPAALCSAVPGPPGAGGTASWKPGKGWGAQAYTQFLNPPRQASM